MYLKKKTQQFYSNCHGKGITVGFVLFFFLPWNPLFIKFPVPKYVHFETKFVIIAMVELKELVAI